MLLTFIFLPMVLAKFPTDTCMVEGEACLADTDNLLSSIPGVLDITVCRQLCRDTEGCEFFSHFGPESFPLQEYCMLFNSCNSLHSCDDCRTEDIICSSLCSSKVEGVFGENNIDVIAGVTEETECRNICRDHKDCSLYTFHDSNDQNLTNLCFLLTKVLEPLQECEHCRTGFPDCSNTTAGVCSFSVGTESTLVTSYKFTEPGNTTVNLLTLGDCELTVVAVGGGGHGSYGGAGSGYVNTTSVKVSTSSLVVTVGGPGEHSGLTTGSGEDIIRAASGEDNHDNTNGGDGYSGGGSVNYSYSGDGGEDGGDGCCEGYGGAGSGLDLSSIDLRQFSLTPGSGGEKHIFGSIFLGGGGGGVLVDGEGPRDRSSDGQGYGGGSGGYWGGTPSSPGPGIVLLEIKPKQ